MKSNDTKALPALGRLARSYGVQTAYYDADRRRMKASPEALLAVLACLDVPIQRPQEAFDAMRARTQACWQRVLEPVAIIWDGSPATVAVRLGQRSANGTLRCNLELDTGQCLNWTCRAGALPTDQTALVEGVTYTKKRLSIPGKLPWGYHALTIQAGAEVVEGTVIVAPTKAYQPSKKRAWGVFLPLYALHSSSSYGAGDLSDLEAMVAWVSRLGGQCVATLPLLAGFLHHPFDPSPYAPVSRLMWNEFYLDPVRTPEFQACPAAGRYLKRAQATASAAARRSSAFVDYRSQMALKRRILTMLADTLVKQPSGRRADFDRFVKSNPQVVDYARFRATCEAQKEPWPSWTPAMRKGTLRRSDYDASVAHAHIYAQWAVGQQIAAVAQHAREANAGLYLDLPLGVHAFGYDAWRYQHILAQKVAGGAPPDGFIQRGQNWGFQPLDPEKSRQDRHRYWVASLRHQFGLASWLRIDHVMSLHRLFWIPDGMAARDGVYVRYPAQELYAILTLESHRHQAVVVGEDLGTVGRDVRLAMARHGVHRMFVGQFEMTTDPACAVHRPFSGSVASLNTHDMPTFAAMWSGSDIRQQQRMGLLDASAATKQRKHRSAVKKALVRYLRQQGCLSGRVTAQNMVEGLVKHLGASSAQMVLVNLEDLWLETRPQNMPGTSEEHPNWVRKARYSLERFARSPRVLRALGGLDQSRRQSPHGGKKTRRSLDR